VLTLLGLGHGGYLDNIFYQDWSVRLAPIL